MYVYHHSVSVPGNHCLADDAKSTRLSFDLVLDQRSLSTACLLRVCFESLSVNSVAFDCGGHDSQTFVNQQHSDKLKVRFEYPRGLSS